MKMHLCFIYSVHNLQLITEMGKKINKYFYTKSTKAVVYLLFEFSLHISSGQIIVICYPCIFTGKLEPNMILRKVCKIVASSLANWMLEMEFPVGKAHWENFVVNVRIWVKAQKNQLYSVESMLWLTSEGRCFGRSKIFLKI